ncbi:MAG: hypothetical protein DRI30_00175 [Chloroflexi bacterium]|nr:MAG: hypothetical protein DRI30_00175 [Chloroflexota bacterium]
MNLTDLIGAIPSVHLQQLEDAPFDITYVFPAKDFGAAANWTEVIESPPGFRGVVRAITMYDVTEIFNEPTTPAYVYVGLSGDIDAFVLSASLGALAADASDSPALTQGATYIIQPNATIHVTGVGVTGVSPTGIATTAVTIQYFK